MKVTFDNSLEVQIGGHFHHYTAGTHEIEDTLAGNIISVYGDRGVRHAVAGSEPEGELPEVTVEEEVPAPESALSRDATPAETAADDAAEERADDRPSRRGQRRTK